MDLKINKQLCLSFIEVFSGTETKQGGNVGAGEMVEGWMGVVGVVVLIFIKDVIVKLGVVSTVIVVVRWCHRCIINWSQHPTLKLEANVLKV